MRDVEGDESEHLVEAGSGERLGQKLEGEDGDIRDQKRFHDRRERASKTGRPLVGPGRSHARPRVGAAARPAAAAR